VNAQQGVIYVVEGDLNGPRRLRQLAGYADGSGSPSTRTIAFGEGLIGQCAAQGESIQIDDVPAGAVQIESGLMNAQPRSIIVLPVLFEDQVKAVIELASLYQFTPAHHAFLEQLSRSIGILLNTIEASMRTESLLSQSQQLAVELQSQQKELQQTNEEIALKAALLAEQKTEVEAKNQQIEQARRALEEKAAELALTSRYKSEFLANMSHELRTPLNSILILGQQLAENPDTNLTPRQVEFAKTIHAAGTDLLHLISDILDLSKIESGTVTVDSEEISFAHLRENLERSFRHDAERRDLEFSVDVAPELGRSLSTDPKRLQQILKNLLSNALKFTEDGSVRLKARPATSGWTPGHVILDTAPMVVAFEVSDTGIGISPEKQRIVFEAFQQADAGTSRKYGGTGLGLAISREIAGLLGGELKL
ncbi:MAG: ATP-binding protein, partial [Pseudomonadota bacterium]|nr:ATP-binding protein [Pseudomonadota bacterium]